MKCDECLKQKCEDCGKEIPLKQGVDNQEIKDLYEEISKTPKDHGNIQTCLLKQFQDKYPGKPAMIACPCPSCAPYCLTP